MFKFKNGLNNWIKHDEWIKRMVCYVLISTRQENRDWNWQNGLNHAKSEVFWELYTGIILNHHIKTLANHTIIYIYFS